MAGNSENALFKDYKTLENKVANKAQSQLDGIKNLTSKIREFQAKVENAALPDRSAFYRDVVRHLNDFDLNSPKTNDPYRVYMPLQRKAQNLRKIVTSWDAMLICSDLAIGELWHRQQAVNSRQAGNESKGKISLNTLTESELIRQRNWRMSAMTKELFFYDEKIQLIELTLYKRGDVETSGRQFMGSQRTPKSKKSSENISIAHSVAIRAPSKSKRKGVKERPKKEQSELDRCSEKYRSNLKKFVSEFSSSIKLDGHLSQIPRYPETPGPSRREPDWLAQPYCASPKNITLQLPNNKKLGSQDPDEVFIQTVAHESFKDKDVSGITSTGRAMVHLMEGIDEYFAVDEGSNNKGITAHMFIVYDRPENVQPQNSETIRNMQSLMLRFCAHYANIQTEIAAVQLRARGVQSERRAAEAQRDRDELRTIAKSVNNQISELQKFSIQLSQIIDENPRVSGYLKWLHEIDGLFKSENENFRIADTGLTIPGDHNSWSRDQLAAALWTFARPTTPQWASASMSPSVLWYTTLGALEISDYNKNSSLHLLHRFRCFDNLRLLDDSEVEQTFMAIKGWRSNNQDREAQDKAIDVLKFQLDEVLFLLGRQDFNNSHQIEESDSATDEDKDYKTMLLKSFSFASQDILEGLLQFANAVDKGFYDQDVQENLRRTQEATKISIRGGIASEAGNNEPVRVHITIPPKKFKKSREAGEPDKEIVNGLLRVPETDSPFKKYFNDNSETDGFFELLIRQHYRLSLRGKNGRADDANAEKRDNFVNLRGMIRFDESTPTSASKINNKKDANNHLKRRDRGRNETSTSAKRALGYFAQFNDPSNDKGKIRPQISDLTDRTILSALEASKFIDIKETDPSEWIGVGSTIKLEGEEDYYFDIGYLLMHYETNTFIFQLRPSTLMPQLS